jgi:hypothetical protein
MMAVILSGGIVLSMATVAALRWRDIAAGYYLFVLEKDPGYFMKASAAPEGSPRREAAERFIAREGSFQRVLQALKEKKAVGSSP